MKEAVVALGSNLCEREENLQNAIIALKKLPVTAVEEISSIYETKPFQTPDCQDDYLNCCVKLQTELSPEMLLGACLGIESAMGRERPFKNAARIIDIDLLLYQGASIDVAHLTLPHPRLKERAFVMVPLSELYKSKVALGLDFNAALSQVDVSQVKLYREQG